MSISKLSVTEGYSNESEEYFPINENYYDILSDCKSLLIEQKMNSIRIIFKEIVDAQSIKRQIYINGIVDMPNKILYSHFLNTFLDYISDLDSFITLPLIFQEYDKKPKNENENNNIYDKVFYVQSAKRQNIYNINGNIIYFEDLIEKNEIKKNLILLIFWQDIKDIESNIKQYLNIAKNYNKYISVIFISDIGDFLKKKSFLQEKNYYRILNVDNPKESEDSNINNNIYFVFDDKFLHNKYYVIKFPWFVISNKNNDEIFDSGILRIEEIQDKIENFLGENPESKQNINNLFWIDLSNKIKLNLIRKINLKLANNNYKNIHFYIETNSSISCQELMSSFDIDAYFIGSLKYQDFNVFKGFAEKICKEEKIQNIHYNIEH